MKLARLCLGWQLRQSRLSLVCPGSLVQTQARLGQVRRQGEGRDGPTPAAARALGQEGEVGYPREETGPVFCFFVHLCLPTLLFHRCVCVHSAFYDTGIRALTKSESGLFLSSSGFCVFHAFKSSGLRVARLRGARGCPRAGVKTSFFFPFLSPPLPPPPLPCPPPSPSRALPASLPSPSFWAGPCSGYTASSAPNAASASARMTS